MNFRHIQKLSVISSYNNLYRAVRLSYQCNRNQSSATELPIQTCAPKYIPAKPQVGPQSSEQCSCSKNVSSLTCVPERIKKPYSAIRSGLSRTRSYKGSARSINGSRTKLERFLGKSDLKKFDKIPYKTQTKRRNCEEIKLKKVLSLILNRTENFLKSKTNILSTVSVQDPSLIAKRFYSTNKQVNTLNTQLNEPQSSNSKSRVFPPPKKENIPPPPIKDPEEPLVAKSDLTQEYENISYNYSQLSLKENNLETIQTEIKRASSLESLDEDEFYLASSESNPDWPEYFKEVTTTTLEKISAQEYYASINKTPEQQLEDHIQDPDLENAENAISIVEFTRPLNDNKVADQSGASTKSLEFFPSCIISDNKRNQLLFANNQQFKLAREEEEEMEEEDIEERVDERVEEVEEDEDVEEDEEGHSLFVAMDNHNNRKSDDPQYQKKRQNYLDLVDCDLYCSRNITDTLEKSYKKERHQCVEDIYCALNDPQKGTKFPWEMTDAEYEEAMISAENILRRQCNLGVSPTVFNKEKRKNIDCASFSTNSKKTDDELELGYKDPESNSENLLLTSPEFLTDTYLSTKPTFNPNLVNNVKFSEVMKSKESLSQEQFEESFSNAVTSTFVKKEDVLRQIEELKSVKTKSKTMTLPIPVRKSKTSYETKDLLKELKFPPTKKTTCNVTNKTQCDEVEFVKLNKYSIPIKNPYKIPTNKRKKMQEYKLFENIVNKTPHKKIKTQSIAHEIDEVLKDPTIDGEFEKKCKNNQIIIKDIPEENRVKPIQSEVVSHKLDKLSKITQDQLFLNEVEELTSTPKEQSNQKVITENILYNKKKTHSELKKALKKCREHSKAQAVNLEEVKKPFSTYKSVKEVINDECDLPIATKVPPPNVKVKNTFPIEPEKARGTLTILLNPLSMGAKIPPQESGLNEIENICKEELKALHYRRILDPETIAREEKERRKTNFSQYIDEIEKTKKQNYRQKKQDNVLFETTQPTKLEPEENQNKNDENEPKKILNIIDQIWQQVEVEAKKALDEVNELKNNKTSAEIKVEAKEVTNEENQIKGNKTLIDTKTQKLDSIASLKSRAKKQIQENKKPAQDPFLIATEKADSKASKELHSIVDLKTKAAKHLNENNKLFTQIPQKAEKKFAPFPDIPKPLRSSTTPTTIVSKKIPSTSNDLVADTSNKNPIKINIGNQKSSYGTSSKSDDCKKKEPPDPFRRNKPDPLLKKQKRRKCSTNYPDLRLKMKHPECNDEVCFAEKEVSTCVQDIFEMINYEHKPPSFGKPASKIRCDTVCRRKKKRNESSSCAKDPCDSDSGNKKGDPCSKKKSSCSGRDMQLRKSSTYIGISLPEEKDVDKKKNSCTSLEYFTADYKDEINSLFIEEIGNISADNTYKYLDFSKKELSQSVDDICDMINYEFPTKTSTSDLWDGIDYDGSPRPYNHTYRVFAIPPPKKSTIVIKCPDIKKKYNCKKFPSAPFLEKEKRKPLEISSYHTKSDPTLQQRILRDRDCWRKNFSLTSIRCDPSDGSSGKKKKGFKLPSVVCGKKGKKKKKSKKVKLPPVVCCKKDPCKKDPCKKKKDPCKKDPCKKKKKNPCKKDPCKKDPCKKREDPCKKKKKRVDPCKKKEDPCKKKDPCKSSDPFKRGPCKPKKKKPKCCATLVCKSKAKKKPKPCKKLVCKKKVSLKKSCKGPKDAFNYICKKGSGVSQCKKSSSKSNPCKKKVDPCRAVKKGVKHCSGNRLRRTKNKKKRRTRSPCKKKKQDPCRKSSTCKKDAKPWMADSIPCKKSKCKKKKPNPCKVSKCKKRNPCKKKKPNPCKVSKCKKPNPCKKKKPNPCKVSKCKKANPCKKKKSNPCKISCKKPKKKASLCEPICVKPKKKAKKCLPKCRSANPCKTSRCETSDPCKKKSAKYDPCADIEIKVANKACKKADPCKKPSPCTAKKSLCKKPTLKTNPCKKKMVCKKRKDPCKKDPCKRDPCKKDPCKKDPCKKKFDPCKVKCKKPTFKTYPCKRAKHPCKKVKKDPCKSKNPCKGDPCKKPTLKVCKKYKAKPCKKKMPGCRGPSSKNKILKTYQNYDPCKLPKNKQKAMSKKFIIRMKGAGGSKKNMCAPPPYKKKTKTAARKKKKAKVALIPPACKDAKKEEKKEKPKCVFKCKSMPPPCGPKEKKPNISLCLPKKSICVVQKKVKTKTGKKMNLPQCLIDIRDKKKKKVTCESKKWLAKSIPCLNEILMDVPKKKKVLKLALPKPQCKDAAEKKEEIKDCSKPPCVKPGIPPTCTEFIIDTKIDLTPCIPCKKTKKKKDKKGKLPKPVCKDGTIMKPKAVEAKKSASKESKGKGDSKGGGSKDSSSKGSSSKGGSSKGDSKKESKGGSSKGGSSTGGSSTGGSKSDSRPQPTVKKAYSTTEHEIKCPSPSESGLGKVKCSKRDKTPIHEKMRYSDPNMHSRSKVCRLGKFTPPKVFRLQKYKFTVLGRKVYRDNFNALCRKKVKAKEIEPPKSPVPTNSTACFKIHQIEVSEEYLEDVEDMIEAKQATSEKAMKSLKQKNVKKDECPMYLQILRRLEEDKPDDGNCNRRSYSTPTFISPGQ